MYKLTNRQKTLLLLASYGATSQEIATALMLSKAAVDSVRRDILRKMHATNMTHAVAKAIAFEIIAYDPDPATAQRILAAAGHKNGNDDKTRDFGPSVRP